MRSTSAIRTACGSGRLNPLTQEICEPGLTARHRRRFRTCWPSHQSCDNHPRALAPESFPKSKETDMGKINFGRVLLGGLVAGLVINIGEYLLNGVVLAKQMEGTFRKMNVPAPGGNFIAIAVALTFLLGILIVWIYALIRPRLGP